MKTQFCTIVFVSITLSLFAQDNSVKKEAPMGEVFTSTQSVTINGNTINLATEAGTLQLRDENDKPIALVGFTYYSKVNSQENRPIVFAFNGGPLEASFWLHFGVLGPKRIEVNDADYTKPAPYSVVNNEYSILDKADLVMIDPVGVGFSKPIGDSKWEDFWGVDKDIRSIGLFIEQFITRSSKFNAPKYLLGESYGTFRNAGLVKYLQNKGIAINGVIMISAVFELHHLLFGPGNDISYLIHFPTYAATAWYHNKIKDQDEDLEKFLNEVRSFVENEYAPALLKGDQLEPAQKESIAQRLAYYSGLSKSFWLKANLRVTNREFSQEVLQEEGKTVGRLDARFTGINEDLLSPYPFSDPTLDAISSPFISSYKDYLYKDLKVRKDWNYTTSSKLRKGFNWDWSHNGNVIWNAQVAISTLPDMTAAMKRNPNLKILILSGYYDLATVFYGVEYSVNHMGLDTELRNNIIMKYYEAGHMMFTHMPSLQKLKKDLDDFIEQTSN